MQAVILAGGLGTRLKPFTKVFPKPMLPVGDRSIMEIQISQLHKYGIKDVTIATNYKSHLIESYFGDGTRFGIKLYYSLEKKKLGTCGPLSLLKDRLTKPFFVINGDVLTNLNFQKVAQFHRKMGGLLTVVSKDVTFPLSYGNLISAGDRIVRIDEKPDISVEIVTGIYMMSPKIFSYIPYNEYFGMDNLIENLLAKQIPVYRYKTDDYWLDIGRMDNYEQAQKDYKCNFK